MKAYEYDGQKTSPAPPSCIIPVYIIDNSTMTEYDL